jgi:hypothetical protein
MVLVSNHLQCTDLFSSANGPHRYGWPRKRKNPWCKCKKAVERSIPRVQNIHIALGIARDKALLAAENTTITTYPVIEVKKFLISLERSVNK